MIFNVNIAYFSVINDDSSWRQYILIYDTKHDISNIQ